MSDASFYNWRAKYGGMDVSMMKRMKELEEDDVQERLTVDWRKCMPKRN